MGVRVGVVGAGRWGTALSILLSGAGHQVRLFPLESELERLLRTRQSPYLENFIIPKEVSITAEIETRDLEILILALPGEYLQETWDKWRPAVVKGTIIVNTAKMIECRDGDLFLPSQIINPDIFHFVHFVSAAFPQGLLRGSPTIGTAFSSDELSSKKIVSLFSDTLIRPYHSRDLNGGQIGCAIKNTIAIAAGIADGLGFDETTRAAIASRGLKEMRDFACSHLGHPETFGAGTTIMTDLVATCFSPYSRNFRFGQALVKKGHQEAQESIKGTIEGIKTTLALAGICHDFAEKMPISEAVCSIIMEKTTPISAMKKLMSRPFKHED